MISFLLLDFTDNNNSSGIQVESENEVIDTTMAEYEDYNEAVQPTEAEEVVDETASRRTWEILTWIFIAFTITLNLVLIAILVLRRNLTSIVNKSERSY